MVDINRATVEELTTLPGIGEVLATRIVKLRAVRGRFGAVDDLLEVEGITDEALAVIRDRITTGPAEPPGPESVTVHLTPPGGGAADYTGHRVTLEGQRLTEDQAAVPFALSAATPPEGTTSLKIPARSLLRGQVEIRAIGPDGTELGSATFDGPTLPAEVTIEVAPQTFGTTQPNTDPSAGRPTRLRGRVIDEAGDRIPAGVQVVIWGARATDPQAADFRALVVADTDAQGHFTGPYPLGTFTAAHATVGIDDPAPTVPVHLDPAPGAAPEDPGTVFPESVILVVDLSVAEADDEEDCDCKGDPGVPRSPDRAELARADGTFSADPGGGRCVDFTKPSRTLEEFTYSYAVRTTEPDIRGFTLDEPPRIGIGVLADYLDIFDSLTTREVARPAEDDLDDNVVVGGRRSRRAPRDTFAAAEAVTADEVEAARALAQVKDLQLDARTVKTLARDPDGFSLSTVAGAARLSVHADLLRALGAVIAEKPSRHRLTCGTSVDWDDDPTIYQACTIAHGHLLRFKQEWVADGYSMGTLLYSLPLAPGQKKQVAVVDWERREAASRTEATSVAESLEAVVDRDRDINEIVSGTVNESIRGGSHSSSGSFAAGFGIGAIIPPVGGLLGIGGGTASADSSAWQTSSRNTAASALNQLRDRTVQSASSLRSLRSSVVTTVSQGERVTATTESVANYNHCHALTIQYFEVLRHLLVRQRIVDVQECLFVPLLMSWFTRAKARRWRHTLSPSVPRPLRDGFAALDRIAHNYAGSDFPDGRYADEDLVSVDGDLRIRFQLTRPRDDEDGEFDPTTWSPLLRLFGFNPADFYAQFLRDQALKDRIFLERLGPSIASSLVSVLQVHALKTDSTSVDLTVDPTLISSFVNDRGLYVTLRMSGDLPVVRRSEVKAVVISAHLQLAGLPFVIDVLPTGSRVIVESATMRYRTAHHSDFLVSDARVNNDLTGSDDVRIETPLNRRELRNPREEDKEKVRDLMDHLNEDIERYHHVLWGGMSPARRFMLLDGFQAPNSDGRSVASVVDNELVGIVGNCLVMPVSPGVHLDPTFNQDVENPIDLLEHYQPNTPIEPTRIALPTRGVYAEAVMGACNSCEIKEEERFWRWEESPIPDSPAAIQPLSTDTRRAEPSGLTPSEFPAPLVAMQNAPAAPDPTGLAGVLGLLGQSGLFTDITGLEGTQRNAAAALEGAFSTATAFGTKAADLALQGKMAKDIDKSMKTIQAAKSRGLIDDKQAQKLTEAAIQGMIGGGATTPEQTTSPEEVESLTKTAGDNEAAVKVTKPTGEKVEVDARPRGAEDSTTPIIILGPTTGTPANRAFNPSDSGGDKSGAITVEASFRNAPEGSRLRWSSPEAGALKIDRSGAERTRVHGLLPGKRDLDIGLFDAGGNRLASHKMKLSVPQYVTVVEDASFDTALATLHLSSVKNEIVAHAKATVEQVLARSNVRVYWEAGGLAESVPAGVPAASVMTATLRDTSANDNLLGITHAPGGVNDFDETIDIFIGAYDTPTTAIDIDTETQALIIQLETTLAAGNVDPALEAIAAKVYGRLVGETLSHEITHGLLWKVIDPSFHNDPAIPDDLMNKGIERLFRQRTGMENTAQVSPVEPDHFVDHGVGDVGVLQATNQALMDSFFPTAT